VFCAGYLLADAGYDVWMGNARGNVYSTRHSRLSTMLPTFWSFRYVKMQLTAGSTVPLQKLRVAQDLPNLLWKLMTHFCVDNRVHPFNVLLLRAHEIHYCNIYASIPESQKRTILFVFLDFSELSPCLL
jgi:hypothetical protein